MQSSQDLNSNLIKSLTSVHLPPPPSSHTQPPHHQLPKRVQLAQLPQAAVKSQNHNDSANKYSQRSDLHYRPHQQAQKEGINPASETEPFYKSFAPDHTEHPLKASFEVPTPKQLQQSSPLHSVIPASSPTIAIEVNDSDLDPTQHSASFPPQALSSVDYASIDVFAEGPYPMMFPNKMLEPELHVVPGQLIQSKSSKRKSSITEELALPLTTPPHTISRTSASSRPTKKTKVQETPTLQQGRAKKVTKNPLSPRYSSPSQINQGEDSDSQHLYVSSSSDQHDVTKPPQPTFTVPKASKKQQRELQRELKKKQEEEEIVVIPHPSKMPKVVYEGDTKPPYSYATLIGMAILRGEGRKLTLSQIYNWISTTFRYYTKNDVGWQNSIRHNLSLNKAFIKAEKSSDGKGHYWEVAKGFEAQFFKGKAGKRSVGSSITATVTTLEESAKDPKSSDSRTDSIPEIYIQEPAVQTYKPSEADDMTSEDEFSEVDDADDHSKTPKSQIRGIDQDVTDRPSLRKSHTAIGLQRLTLPNVQYQDISEDEFGDESTKIPKKKLQLRSISTGNGPLSNIPSLEAPETNWAASALGERIIFGQVRPGADSPKAHTSSFPVTSSFSCNTNFEMSPLKRHETGPLLEPLTPSSRIPSFASTTSAASHTYPSTQQSLAPSSMSQRTGSSNTPLKNTSSSHQNVTNGLLGSATSNHLYHFLKTPVAKGRTPNPNTNSIVRKFWNSPAFIDDFYTSPSIPRHSDGPYHEALFGSPGNKGRKSQFMESSSHYGYSEVFGVDICSVMKRAMDSVNESNTQCVDNGSTTDDDADGTI